LEKHHGIREVSLAGLCAGAYYSLRAAVAALPVTRILMVNPIYYWHDEKSLEDVQEAELVRDTGVYQDRTFSLGTCETIAQGSGKREVRTKELQPSPIGGLWRRYAQFGETHANSFIARSRLGAGGSCRARCTNCISIRSGEPGLHLLNLQAGATLRRLGERCRVHVLESGDHVFSKSGPREVMSNILSDELEAR